MDSLAAKSLSGRTKLSRPRPPLPKAESGKGTADRSPTVGSLPRPGAQGARPRRIEAEWVPAIRAPAEQLNRPLRTLQRSLGLAHRLWPLEGQRSEPRQQGVELVIDDSPKVTTPSRATVRHARTLPFDHCQRYRSGLLGVPASVSAPRSGRCNPRSTRPSKFSSTASFMRIPGRN